jgi:hypothetical protein
LQQGSRNRAHHTKTSQKPINYSLLIHNNYTAKLENTQNCQPSTI